MFGFNSKKKDVQSFAVVGLGRFGDVLVDEFTRYGNDFLAIDKDEYEVRETRLITDQVVRVDRYDKKCLTDTGVKNCDVAIVCIDDLTDALLATLNLVGLGVPKVYAVANTPEAGEIMEKIGAEVVYPKKDMATRLAARLQSDLALDFVQLNEKINIYKAVLPANLVGKTVVEAALRVHFGLNIIAIQSGDKVNDIIKPDYVFAAGDVLYLAGSEAGFKKLTDWADDN